MEKPNDDIIIACELKFIEMLDPAISVYLQLIEELNLYDIIVEWIGFPVVSGIARSSHYNHFNSLNGVIGFSLIILQKFCFPNI